MRKKFIKENTYMWGKTHIIKKNETTKIRVSQIYI